MTDQQHPITPPPELVQQWLGEFLGYTVRSGDTERYLATQAARWGADQELEACCEWVEGYAECGISLRVARRPKPPSLAEEALQELERTVILLMPVTGPNKVKRFAAIRRALERLQELEGAND